MVQMDRDVQQWTSQRVLAHLQDHGDSPQHFFENFFGWDSQDLLIEARTLAWKLIKDHHILELGINPEDGHMSRFPSGQADKNAAVSATMRALLEADGQRADASVRLLFRPDWHISGTFPAWYQPGLMPHDSNNHQTKWLVLRKFLRWVWNQNKPAYNKTVIKSEPQQTPTPLPHPNGKRSVDDAGFGEIGPPGADKRRGILYIGDDNQLEVRSVSTLLPKPSIEKVSLKFGILEFQEPGRQKILLHMRGCLMLKLGVTSFDDLDLDRVRTLLLSAYDPERKIFAVRDGGNAFMRIDDSVDLSLEAEEMYQELDMERATGLEFLVAYSEAECAELPPQYRHVSKQTQRTVNPDVMSVITKKARSSAPKRAPAALDTTSNMTSPQLPGGVEEPIDLTLTGTQQRAPKKASNQQQINIHDDEDARKAAQAAEKLQKTKEACLKLEALSRDIRASESPFHRMVRGAQNPPPTFPPQCGDPGVQFQSEAEARFVEWLSSEMDDDIEVDPTDAAELVEKSLAARHLTKENWSKFCAFFDFDPDERDPNATVHFPGWSSGKPLLVFQAYCITIIIRQIARGEQVFIAALAMGLGKTFVGLGLIRLLNFMHHIYEYLGHCPTGPITHAHMWLQKPVPDLPTFDLAKLAEQVPTVRGGPALYVAPPHLLEDAIDEAVGGKRNDRPLFDQTSDPLFIVLLKAGKPTRAEKAAFPWNNSYVLHPDQTIPHGHAAFPSDADLRKYYSDDELEELHESGISVKDILQCSSSGRSCPWQRQFVVMVPDSVILTNQIMTYNSIQDAFVAAKENPIDACWSVAVVDEFHKVSAPGAGPWTVLSGLRGDPPIVGMSGTPYVRPSDLAAIFTARDARFFQSVEEGGRQKRYDDVAPGLIKLKGDGKNVTWSSSLSTNQRKKVRDDRLWVDMMHAASKLSNFANSSIKEREKRLAAGADMEDVRFGLEEQDAVKTFGGWLQKYTIQWTVDEKWRPTEDFPSRPMVSIPPHSSFDVHLPIDDDYAQLMNDEYTKGIQMESKGSGSDFISFINRMRVFTTFPCLIEAFKTDAAFKAKVKSFNKDDAEKVLASGKKSRLWTYMPKIHKGGAMQALRLIIQTKRAEQNFAGKGNKLIIGCFKPFNLVVLKLYLDWLSEQRPGSAHHYPDLTSKEDFFILHQFKKDVETTKSEETNMDGFLTTVNKVVGYQDRPFLLAAAVSRICVGKNLAPANTTVLLDQDWNPSQVRQFLGRVRRNRMTQKAMHTWSYRLVQWTEDCRFAYLMTNKQSQQSQVMQALRKGGTG